MHCSLLAEQAIKAAIHDYKEKQKKLKGKKEEKGAKNMGEEIERIKHNLETKAEEVKL